MIMVLGQYLVGLVLLLGGVGTLILPDVAASSSVGLSSEQVILVYVKSQTVGCCEASWGYGNEDITELRKVGFTSALHLRVHNTSHTCSDVIALGPFDTWEDAGKILPTLKKKATWVKKHLPRKATMMSRQEWQDARIIPAERAECKPPPELPEPDLQLFVRFAPGCIQAIDKEGDTQKICVNSPYWLGRKETTVAQYSVCVHDGRCQPPVGNGPWCHWPDHQKRYLGDSYPINCLSLEQINTFFHWYSEKNKGLTFHLPTSEQWLRAALGRENIKDEDRDKDKDKDEICQGKKGRPNLCAPPCPPPSRVVSENSGWAAGASVDRDPICLTNGLVDMVGNVAELVRVHGPDDQSLTLMGGGWRTFAMPKLSLATLEMLEKPLSEKDELPLNQLPWAGFRMAVDRPQGTK